ncbi:MAG: hypothetical protein VX007_01080 [Pseudomonadota bacterium]|nr:hypothetical protein [Pseudomonadota bacterium]
MVFYDLVDGRSIGVSRKYASLALAIKLRVPLPRSTAERSKFSSVAIFQFVAAGPDDDYLAIINRNGTEIV